MRSFRFPSGQDFGVTLIASASESDTRRRNLRCHMGISSELPEALRLGRRQTPTIYLGWRSSYLEVPVVSGIIDSSTADVTCLRSMCLHHLLQFGFRYNFIRTAPEREETLTGDKGDEAGRWEATSADAKRVLCTEIPLDEERTDVC